MGGKIEAWLDVNSFYSRFALLHLRRYKKQLESYGIEYDIHPVLLGAINVGSDNKPPWTLPAKAAHSRYDTQRANKYYGIGKTGPPDGFPFSTLLPMRAMCYIKATFSKQQYETSFLELWTAMWEQNVNVSKPELLVKVLERHFSKSETKDILEATQDAKWKAKLAENTEAALKHGAFGAPWFWVRNAQGEEEPFFGSERFHFMWNYLGIPHHDFEVLSKTEAKI